MCRIDRAVNGGRTCAFGCVNSMPGGRFMQVFMIFGGFGEFGLGVGNVEKSRFLNIFEHVGFGADFYHLKRVRDRSGRKR